MSRYLVSGGAGYVGSHVVLALLDAGHEVVVVDDLSTGHRGAVSGGATFIHANLSERKRLGEIFAAWKFDAVFHLAALSLVGDSMKDPLRYCRENLSNSLNLAETAMRAGCLRFVLSSTAAVFGVPRVTPILEDAPTTPVNPYGQSKLMIEQALAWAEGANGLHSAALRYFNAAGADPRGRAGEDHQPETHLIPRAILATLGHAPPLHVFGTDYDTPDGTAIRDYVHVTDLAAAHIAVLPRLERGSVRYNIGNGAGHSVREVMAAIERVSGRKVPYENGPRRAGDPPSLVASSALIRAETGWTPRHAGLDEIVRTAWNWHLANPQGYAARQAA
ncbi:UDP-glucose 4-epimerase GalE [Roseococcus sp. SYP-B2431]|uniref:UDP-glucose 4-epimerase GalE n=1 Tax=Roseococcus sp. SYP-B2431 TaxID=2496640 RepID=UPI00103EBE7A|nr:UDP-glucose 4-epimerase GalE [Roseococcus sp. SYP-B2431]TCH96415.1 UDP-glucose 4-epimerase GalE [Roseococcus sp. SYP-B2431]